MKAEKEDRGSTFYYAKRFREWRKKLSLNFPENLWDRILREAERKGIAPSTAILNALDKAVPKAIGRPKKS